MNITDDTSQTTLEHDEEGLLSYYDLVVYGTGLVESIVSCAAAKAGKSVLHLDRNDFYGNEDYSTFGSLSTFKSNQIKIRDVEQKDINYNYDSLNSIQMKIHGQNSIHEVIEFVDNSLLYSKQNIVSCLKYNGIRDFHPSCFEYLMEKNPIEVNNKEYNIHNCHPSFLGYIKHNKLTIQRTIHKQREFNIDYICPKLIFSYGQLIDCMINSGVSNYLEFKCIEGLHLVDVDGKYGSVPCSKMDVFNSTQLSMQEKRSLMKLHQSVSDWNLSSLGQEVYNRNEIELAVGRSLYRPQNKEKREISVQDGDEQFVSFLDKSRLSEKLKSLVVHGLCLYPMQISCGQNYATRKGVQDLNDHVASLGHYGETAFLLPMYGLSEMVQSFCRMSAVCGSTFILRREIRRVCLSADHSLVEIVEDSQGKRIKCGAFLCGAEMVERVACEEEKLKLLLFGSLLHIGQLLPSDSSGRRVVVIVPNMKYINSEGMEVVLGNDQCVYVIQSDSSTHATPEGVGLIQIVTVISKVNNEEVKLLYHKIIHYLIFLSSSKDFKEICHSLSIRNIIEESFLTDSNIPSNMEIVPDFNATSYSLTLKRECDCAFKIFTKLFPNDLFFPPSDANNNQERNEFEGEQYE